MGKRESTVQYMFVDESFTHQGSHARESRLSYGSTLTKSGALQAEYTRRSGRGTLIQTEEIKPSHVGWLVPRQLARTSEASASS